MSQTNFIVKGNNNYAETTITDILKRSVVAIGCFVGVVYSGQGLTPSNNSINYQALIQRNIVNNVSSHKKDEKLMPGLGNLYAHTANAINLPILKAVAVGYTVSVEASEMTNKRHDIRKSIPASTKVIGGYPQMQDRYETEEDVEHVFSKLKPFKTNVMVSANFRGSYPRKG